MAETALLFQSTKRRIRREYKATGCWQWSAGELAALTGVPVHLLIEMYADRRGKIDAPDRMGRVLYHSIDDRFYYEGFI